MSDDGGSGEARHRLARGTAPRPLADTSVGVPAAAVAVGSARVSAGAGARDEPARSIQEAVERLIDAVESDAAIAEWMQGGG